MIALKINPKSRKVHWVHYGVPLCGTRASLKPLHAGYCFDHTYFLESELCGTCFDNPRIPLLRRRVGFVEAQSMLEPVFIISEQRRKEYAAII